MDVHTKQKQTHRLRKQTMLSKRKGGGKLRNEELDMQLSLGTESKAEEWPEMDALWVCLKKSSASVCADQSESIEEKR